jgi:hypothetical protein
MPGKLARHSRPRLERLEARLNPSAVVPANTIGTASGSVTRPRSTSAAEVAVSAENLTAGKHATLLGIFVQPTSSNGFSPRIIGIRESNGRSLPLQQGRPFVAGRDSGEAAAFAKVDRAGPLTILVAGGGRSTGTFQVSVTLAGDVDGDGKVTLADLTAFAPAYESSRGMPNYVASADFNLNGIVNLYDAKALMHNMPAPPREVALQAVVNLLPSDQAQFPASKNSGGSTFKKEVTIVGHTIPGSIVITDSPAQDYSFTGPAVATDAAGNFRVTATNKEGINNNDLLILEPFGRQKIRDFPVFWIPFAQPGSRLK